MVYGSYQKIECLDCDLRWETYEGQEDVIRIAKEHKKKHPKIHARE